MSKYQYYCNTPSDINEHLPTIAKYASECKNVCEFGVRDVVSSWAILEGLTSGSTWVGVDVYRSRNLDEFKKECKSKAVNNYFINDSTLNENLKVQTDFLFIDTLHTYAQLSQELEKHGNSAKKYLGFHDVVSFAYTDEEIYNHADNKVKIKTEKKGLLPAIFEFLQANTHWKIDYFSMNNNGLLILKRD